MTIVLTILIFCILAVFIAFLRGKNLPEKVMLLNSMNNYIILLICSLSLLQGRESFIDIAYIYILFSFSINLCLMKIFKERQDD